MRLNLLSYTRRSLSICCKRVIAHHVTRNVTNSSVRFESTNNESPESNQEVGPEISQIEEQVAKQMIESIGSNKVRIDPEDTFALLFPGQGSQYVGMAKSLLKYPNVKDMFEVASEILGLNLLTLCMQGPKSQLDKTIHCQPAVVITSLAGIEKLQCESPQVLERCYMAAGYSVGEFAALVFAGALSFEDAMSLIKVRSTYMQKASDETGGGMISVIGGAKTKFNLACSEAIQYCQEKLELDNVVCKVSGYLSPNVRTIAGHRAALEYIVAHKKNYFMHRVHILPVSGAFHTPMMYPAYKELKAALKSVSVESPLIKVYSNIDGSPYRGPKDIINKLPSQIIKPVKWEQTLHNLFARSSNVKMPNVYELGPGSQLGTLVKQCNGKAWLNYLPVDDSKLKSSNEDAVD